MSQEPSTLYAKLLGETSTIEWKALQPFFAKGDLLWVEQGLDLIEAAQAVTQDDAEKVSAWMASGLLGRMTGEQALDVLERDPQLWAVVVSPCGAFWSISLRPVREWLQDARRLFQAWPGFAHVVYARQPVRCHERSG